MARELFLKMDERELSMFQSLMRIVKRLQQLNPKTTEDQVVELIDKTMESILKPAAASTPVEKPSSTTAP